MSFALFLNTAFLAFVSSSPTPPAVTYSLPSQAVEEKAPSAPQAYPGEKLELTPLL